MQPIKEVAASYGIGEDDLELYGKYKQNFQMNSGRSKRTSGRQAGPGNSHQSYTGW